MLCTTSLCAHTTTSSPPRSEAILSPVCFANGCCWVHSCVSTQHVGWVWLIPGITASYLRCAYNHNSPGAAYCRAKPCEIYSEAGIKPLDFVIIHQPKGPPCTHPAIFIPRLNVFSQLHPCTGPGQRFSHRRQLFAYFRRYLNLGNNSMFAFSLLRMQSVSAQSL